MDLKSIFLCLQMIVLSLQEHLIIRVITLIKFCINFMLYVAKSSIFVIESLTFKDGILVANKKSILDLETSGD